MDLIFINLLNFKQAKAFLVFKNKYKKQIIAIPWN